MTLSIITFITSEVTIGYPVYDSISRGQVRYYIIPFSMGGVTIRVEVFRGRVWCYVSDVDRNPNSENYIWRLFISGYNDSYIDPTSLQGRTPGELLFVAIEGADSTNNNFTLNSTSGDTSITGTLTNMYTAQCIISHAYRCQHWNSVKQYNI